MRVCERCERAARPAVVDCDGPSVSLKLLLQSRSSRSLLSATLRHRHTAVAIALALSSTLACSGSTTEAPGGGGTAGGGTAGASGRGGDFSITPGGGPALGGATSTNPEATRELTGPAYFDMDCSADGFPEPNACTACELTSCEDELADALGDDWASGNADGPCLAWFDCVQVCPCNDVDCYRGCISQLAKAPCNQAALRLDACVNEQCSADCSQ
jgi:hypothetical protein